MAAPRKKTKANKPSWTLCHLVLSLATKNSLLLLPIVSVLNTVLQDKWLKAGMSRTHPKFANTSLLFEIMALKTFLTLKKLLTPKLSSFFMPTCLYRWRGPSHLVLHSRNSYRIQSRASLPDSWTARWGWQTLPHSPRQSTHLRQIWRSLFCLHQHQ